MTSCSLRCARSPASRRCSAAVATYQAAPAKAQAAWTTAYETGLAKASASPSGTISVSYRQLRTAADDDDLTAAASPRAGGLDGALLTSKQFYQTDYTKPLLFMADGGVLAKPRPGRASARHASGE